jgi:alpha-mannosidase
VLRLWECHGGRGEVTVRWNLPVATAHRVDLLDRPMEGDCRHDGAVTKVRVRPWEIVTIRVD